MRTRDQVDTILWAIAVRGPEAAFDWIAHIRQYRKNEYTTYMQIRQALEDAGMSRTDTMELVLGKHSRNCACWPCVMGLGMRVRKHLARMQAAETMRNERRRADQH